MAATQAVDQQDLYKQLDAYDWDNDREFQGGLRAILGSSSSPEQLEHLTTRAKCFFYSRYVLGHRCLYLSNSWPSCVTII